MSKIKQELKRNEKRRNLIKVIIEEIEEILKEKHAELGWYQDLVPCMSRRVIESFAVGERSAYKNIIQLLRESIKE